MTTEVIDEGAAVRGRSVGGYRLLQPLGEGGMGVVHLALDRQGKAVALKLLRPQVSSDPEARARLRREVDALGRIRSPRVAPIIDAELEGDQPFIVTRYVPGPALDDVVEQDGPLGGEQLHALADGLVEAIEAIHDAGVVHRDVKPGNVLLLDDDSPVLIDFGIAHLTDDVRLTQVGLVMGTPGYLAPEIIEGGDVTRATDWWGWAATLAYAASGRPPFGKGAMESVLARVSRGEPDLAGADPGLSPLLYAALSPRSTERPEAREIVLALERLAAGGQVTEAITLRRATPATVAVDTSHTAVLPTPPPPPAQVPAPALAPALPVAAARAPMGPRVAAPPVSAPSAHPHASQTAWVPPASTAAAMAPPVPESAVQPWTPSQAQPPVPGSGQQTYGMPPATGGQVAAPAVAGAGDPRIGKPTRSGTLAASLIFVVVAFAVAPLVTTIGVFLWLVMARLTDHSTTALVLRRHEHGRRRSDVPVAIASGPWHLVMAVLGAGLTLLLPALVAVSAAFSTALVLSAAGGRSSDPTSMGPVAVGGLFAMAMIWWGPGGASTRRGSRSLVRALSPGGLAPALVVVLIAAALGLAAWGLISGVPNWWPSAGPVTWTGPSLR